MDDLKAELDFVKLQRDQLKAEVIILRENYRIAESEATYLKAWQREVCRIIQPAQSAEEWGKDVSQIIEMRLTEAGNLRDLVIAAIVLFECDRQPNEIGADERIWLDRARSVLRGDGQIVPCDIEAKPQ